MRRPSFLLLFILTLALSCATNNAVSPNLNPTSQLHSTSQSPNRAILSIGTISISDDRSVVDLIPMRTTELHLNMVKLLEGKACDDCLQIGNFAVTSSGVMHCEVTLKHPFPNAKKYTGFDVRAVLITGSDYTFPISGHTISSTGEHLKLLYADGHTNLFNPTEFPVSLDVPDALKYIPGKLSTGGDLTATLNPYIAFKRDAARRMFSSGQAETNKFVLQLPPGTIEFGYVVDACWTPVDGTITNPLEDFPSEANCLEAYQIYTRQGAGLTNLAGSNAPVQVEVWDHQGIETVSTVLLEAPDLFTGTIELSLSNTTDERIIFEGTVTNEFGADFGDYPVLTRVIDLEPDGNLGPIDAWNVTDFNITESGYPLKNMVNVEISDPSGRFFMGRDPDNYSSDCLGMADPGHMHPVSSFWISKYEVTAGEYADFMAAGGYYNQALWSSEGWEWRIDYDRTKPFAWGTTQGEHKPDLPVAVAYFEAEAFCNWVGGRLPTEPEWELAARGEDHRLYPWGNEWDPAKCAVGENPDWFNFVDNQIMCCPVGTFGDEGASPYGLLDCVGNLQEWTSYWASEFDEYEFYIYQQWYETDIFDPIPGPNPGQPPRKVTRGGGYGGFDESWLTFYRIASGGGIDSTWSSGFRVIRGVSK